MFGIKILLDVVLFDICKLNKFKYIFGMIFFHFLSFKIESAGQPQFAHGLNKYFNFFLKCKDKKSREIRGKSSLRSFKLISFVIYLM
jgi:hypothetical protein